MATADVDVAIRPREAAPAVARRGRRRLRPGRVVLNAFLIVTALCWLAPLLWAVYTSLRPYADTAARGYFSLPGQLNFDNVVNA
jgi:multiple sugar transport system permease protein